MVFVFLLMNGNKIVAVECVDLDKEESTIEQAIEDLANKYDATAYAVLGDTTQNIWLLQQTKKIKRGNID